MKSSYILRTLEESRLLAKQLAQHCPNPDTAFVGLFELLINAIEHGNLEITYAQKSQLQAQDAWEGEIERRLALPEYANREVHLQTWQTDKSRFFLIRDQGKGFDWRPFLAINPERLLHSHGRGIAMAHRLAFDSLEYRGCGNEVLATINIGKSGEAITGVQGDYPPDGVQGQSPWQGSGQSPISVNLFTVS